MRANPHIAAPAKHLLSLTLQKVGSSSMMIDIFLSVFLVWVLLTA